MGMLQSACSVCSLSAVSVYFRCYAALGDVAKARYLREVGKLADKIHTETVSTLLCSVTQTVGVLCGSIPYS